MTHCILALAALLYSLPLAGTWTGEMTDLEGGRGGAYLQLQEQNGKITGVTGASKTHTWPIQNAIYADNRLTFTAVSIDPKSGEQSKWVFELEVTGDRMQGTAEGSRDGHTWKLKVELKRE